MATYAQSPDYHHASYQNGDPVFSMAEMTQAKWKAWTNFKHLILGGGMAAILALGVIWWITY